MTTHSHKLPPTCCDVCSSANVHYVNEASYQPSKISYRAWPFVYLCLDCGASVGTHPGTNSPVGFMAGPYMRRLRAHLHSYFDPIWRAKLATRAEMYAWLAKELSLSEEFAHIAQLSIPQLKQGIELCSKYYAANLNAIKAYDKRR